MLELRATLERAEATAELELRATLERAEAIAVLELRATLERAELQDALGRAEANTALELRATLNRAEASAVLELRATLVRAEATAVLELRATLERAEASAVLELRATLEWAEATAVLGAVQQRRTLTERMQGRAEKLQLWDLEQRSAAARLVERHHPQSFEKGWAAAKYAQALQQRGSEGAHLLCGCASKVAHRSRSKGRCAQGACGAVNFYAPGVRFLRASLANI